MATSKPDKDLCRLVTPEFRVSYPHVFKPQAPKGSDKLKYSVTMLFPKDSELMGQTVDGKPRSLKEAIRNAKTTKYGPKESWPDGLESPVINGDDPKYADKPGYAGHWVIKASTNEDNRPQVVGPDMVPITEPSEFYPGCYARAFVYAYVWEYMGKKGVGFILDHVQKLRDGKSFGGKKSVDQVFTPVGGGLSSPEEETDGDDMDFR